MVLKRVARSLHPQEIPIGQFLCSAPLSFDPRNHCCPVLDVLDDPHDGDLQLLVMPLLRRYNSPKMHTIGEAVSFFQQAFEVWSRSWASVALDADRYLRVSFSCTSIMYPTGSSSCYSDCSPHLYGCPSDCMTLNIMFDPRGMYPKLYHFVSTDWTRDYRKRAPHYSRTRRPCKYYWTDFGISRRHDADSTNPLEIPILGGDHTAPEFHEDESMPRNPFHTDIYYLGNLIREDFLQVRTPCMVRSMATD